jgi:hypothetical protein
LFFLFSFHLALLGFERQKAALLGGERFAGQFVYPALTAAVTWSWPAVEVASVTPDAESIITAAKDARTVVFLSAGAF